MKKFVLIALLLTACKKEEMSSSECQQHYDEIMSNYNSTVEDLSTRLQNNQITYNYYVVHVNSAVDQANSDAHAYTDCMGWQNLMHIE